MPRVYGGGGSSLATPVSAANGGTGANNSAATGLQQWSAGTGSVSDTLTRNLTTQAKVIFNTDVSVGNENAIGQQSGVLTLGSGGGGPIQFRHTGTGTATLGTSGMSMSVPILLPSPVSSTNGSTWLGNDANGPIFNVGAGGGGGALQVFSGNALNTSINEKYGILFAADQTGAGGPTCQIYRTSGHLNVNGPYTGDVSLQTNSTTNLAVNSTGATFSAGVDIISPAAGFALRSPGVAFTNDGNWTNLYSLAAGTHNGRFYLSCALFAGFAVIRVNGTSIDIPTDDWGYADTTAASGKIAFRISGGYLQYNCGTGISSTPKYMHVDFVGIAR